MQINNTTGIESAFKGLVRHVRGVGDSANYNKGDIYLAEVNSVDISKRTCEVTLVTDNTVIVPDVQLMVGVDDGALYIPTVGSNVIISHQKNLMPFVMLYSELDKVIFIVGDTEISLVDGTAIISQDKMAITLSNGTINITNGGKDFKKIMDNIFTHILALTVGTGTGPSTVPINASDFTQDKQDFDTLFS